MKSLDILKTFPHLTHAPIVEAVIEIRSNTDRQMDEKTTMVLLKQKLPEYPQIEIQRGFTHSFSIGPDQKPHQEYSDLGFNGFRLFSSDKLQISVFGKENYSFSRLYPYENWNRFSTEALRLWEIYKELRGSSGINRIGVRFINKITLSHKDIRYDKYLKFPPTSPGGIDMPFISFFHQDTFAVSDHGYVINFIRTTQPSPEGIPNLLLDIDIFTEKNISSDNEKLVKQLDEMRFLKNSMFFNSITKEALEMLK